MDDILILSDDDLAGLGITPGEIATAIENALIAKAGGRLHTAPKAALMPGGGRYMMSTLAVGDDGLTVVKTVTVSPDNPAKGLPTINGAIQVLDAETGLLRAVMGANWITAHRTAGLSAVAARSLAPKHAETVAFVGTGVQAQSHLDAFADMFPLKHVQAYGRGAANLARLEQKTKKMGLSFKAAKTPREALSDADLIVTSVTLDYTIEPFLDASWLKPGAFAAITDLTIPWLPESLAHFGTIVVDDLEQERASERPMVNPGQIAGDLTELVAGTVPLAEGDAPSAFAFRGISLGDYAVATLALSRAEALKG